MQHTLCLQTTSREKKKKKKKKKELVLLKLRKTATLQAIQTDPNMSVQYCYNKHIVLQ